MELIIGDTQLKCYEDGRIECLHKQSKKWRVVKGSKIKSYLEIKIEDKIYKFHRIIYKAFNPDWDLGSPLVIDHINRDTKDNRIENLRLVTIQENAFNRNAKGYTIIKAQKYQGQIIKDGKKYASYFDTEQEARDWYLQQKEILHTYSSSSP